MECEAVLTLCFLNQLWVSCSKINRRCRIMKKSSSSRLAPRGCYIFKAEYCTIEHRYEEGPSWGFWTAGRVHPGHLSLKWFSPGNSLCQGYVLAILPFYWFISEIMGKQVFSLPSPIIPTLCLAAPSGLHGVGMIFNGTQIFNGIGFGRFRGQCGNIKMANRNPAFCLSIFQR